MYVLKLISKEGEVKWEREYSSSHHKDMLRVFTVIHTLVNNIKHSLGEELHGMKGFVIEESDVIEIKHKSKL